MTTVRLSDIPDSGILPIALASGERVVLLRHNGIVTALSDECTHQAMPLSAGELCEDGSIECPWHGARFDATTGTCRRGPATDDVRVFAVELDGEMVRVARAPAE